MLVICPSLRFLQKARQNALYKFDQQNFTTRLFSTVFLNTCYSFSAIDRAFSITSWYKLNENKNKIISLGSSQSNEIESIFERKKESIEAFGWYESITKSIYG